MNSEGIEINAVGKSDKSVKRAMKKAQAVAPKMQRIAASIAKEFGASVTPMNLKSENSIKRKLKSDPSIKGIEDIKDLARTTIIVSKENIGNVLKRLSERPEHIRTKNQTNSHEKGKDGTSDLNKFHGYTGNIVNLNINGQTVEIQVNTPEMIYAKEKREIAVKLLGKKKYKEILKKTHLSPGMGHAYYEELRGDGHQRKRKGGKQRIHQDSVDYYSVFS